MSKYISQETIQQIQEMQNKGISLSQISRELHLSLNTIKKYITINSNVPVTVEVIEPFKEIQQIQPLSMRVIITLDIEKLYFLEKYKQKSGLKSIPEAVIQCIDEVIKYWANYEPNNENQNPTSNINKLIEYALAMKMMRNL